MVDNVVTLPCITKLDLRPDKVLEEAKGKTSDGVVVIGYTEDGELYFASSIAAGPEVLWLLEKAKKEIIAIGWNDG